MRNCFEALIKKTSLKSYVTAQLKAVHDSLTAEQQQSLVKHGDITLISQKADEKIKALKDLQEEMKRLAPADLASWETRKDQIVTELESEQVNAEKLKEAAQELKNQLSEDKRSAKNAEFYQKNKIINKLVDAMGCGKEFAKSIAGLWRGIEQNGMDCVVSDVGELNWGKVMVWTRESERGKKALAKIDEYQKACKESLSEKVVALKAHLDNNDKKEGAMVTVLGNGTADEILPPLKDAFELPDDELYLQEEGASAWIATSLPWTYRQGPGVLPLPGFGSLVQRKGDCGVVLVAFPVKPLVDAGVVVLSEVRAFFNQDAGGKLVADHANLIMWKPEEDHLVWLPYGHLPMMISNDEKCPSHLWFLPVFSKHLVMDCPTAVWQPVVNLNMSVLQKHSGQSTWAARLATATKLIDARAEV